MQISRIVLVASLLFFSTSKAIAFPIASSENLKTNINLAQQIAPEEQSIWKNAALGSLAIALAEIGDRDRAVEIFANIDNRDIRTEVLLELGLRLAKKGEVELAWNLIKNGENLNLLFDIFQDLIAEENIDRAWEWVQLAREEDNRIIFIFIDAAIANNKYDRAWEILRNMARNSRQLVSLRGLAFGYAEEGRGDRILEIVDILDDNGLKQDLILLAALSFTEDGKPKQALNIIPRLERNLNRIHALGAIGLKLMENGERDRGEEQFARLRELLPQLEESDETNSVLSNLSTYLARGGEFELALELSDRISNPVTKTESLFYIARSLAEAGKFIRALELSAEIDISGLRENAIQQVAINLAKNRRGDRALSLLRTFTNTDETLKDIATILAEQEQFDLALEVAETIEEIKSKIVAFGAIAFHLQQDRQLENAREVLARTFQLWNTVDTPSLKDFLLGLIVIPFVDSESYALSLELLEKTTTSAERKETLLDSVYTVAATGKREESLQFIALIEDKIEKIGALIFLTIQLDRQDQKEAAIATLTDALELSETLQNPAQKAALLSSIATQFAELERSQQASEIVDRALKLLEI